MTARFLLDDGFIAQLASVDSSYAERCATGRIWVAIDYRNGQPLQAQLYRMPPAVNFNLRLSLDSA